MSDYSRMFYRFDEFRLGVSRISGFFQCFQFSVGSSVGYQFEIQLDDCSRWFQLNVSNRERGSRIEGCRPSEIGSWFWRKRWREEKRKERKIRTKTYERGKREIKNKRKLSEGPRKRIVTRLLADYLKFCSPRSKMHISPTFRPRTTTILLSEVHKLARAPLPHFCSVACRFLFPTASFPLFAAPFVTSYRNGPWIRSVPGFARSAPPQDQF